MDKPVKTTTTTIALCAVVLIACSENPRSTQGGTPATPSQQGDLANSLPTVHPSPTQVIPRTEPKPGIVAPTCDPAAPERRAGMRVVLVYFHCALRVWPRGIRRFPLDAPSRKLRLFSMRPFVS